MHLQRLMLILVYWLTFVKTENRFTNIKCFELDPTFATFEKCQLKLIRRGTIAMSVTVALHKKPVRNSTVNLAMFKKANGYRPFLYNVTVDFCEFVKNRKKIPFLKIFFDALVRDSNMNHSCPYDHDLIVDNLVLKEDMFRLMPLPEGDYMFKLMVGAYNDWMADVRIYLSKND